VGAPLSAEEQASKIDHEEKTVGYDNSMCWPCRYEMREEEPASGGLGLDSEGQCKEFNHLARTKFANDQEFTDHQIPE